VIIAVLVLKDSHEGVLLACRRNTGREDGKYNFPSTEVKEGESPLSALILSTRNRLGDKVADELLIRSPTLKYVLWQPSKSGDAIELYFMHETVCAKTKVFNSSPDDKWVKDRVSLPENIVANHKMAYEKIFRGAHLGVEGLYQEMTVRSLRDLG